MIKQFIIYSYTTTHFPNL